MSCDPIVELEDVSVSLDGNGILTGVSLSVEQGELLGLVGPNGAGKTTLLRTINGLLTPEKGEVFLDGTPITEMDSRAISRRVGTVPQDPTPAFEFTVEDIVEMGRTPYRGRFDVTGDSTDRKAINRALEQTATADLRDRSITAISGGERQRVYVARALAQDTPILALDEPTVSLDINHQVRILELIRKLLHDGKGAIAAIHDLDLAARFCDRLALLDEGSIQAMGRPESVLTDEHLDTAFDTQTTVSPDPVTGTPRITVRPERRRERERSVHVLGHGAIAARAIGRLWQAGFNVSVGPIAHGDIAKSVAEKLGVETINIHPLGAPEEATIEQVREYCQSARATVLCDHLADTETLEKIAVSSEKLVRLKDPAIDQGGENSEPDFRAETRPEPTTTSIQGLVIAIAETTPSSALPADD